MERWAVLWYWEAIINANLENGLVFDKPIYIKKKGHCYIGYFTVNNPDLYGQLIVNFGRTSFKAYKPMIFSKKDLFLLYFLSETDHLIFDKRSEFDWLAQGKN